MFSKRAEEWSELCLQQIGNGWTGHHGQDTETQSHQGDKQRANVADRPQGILQILSQQLSPV